jgi:YesN/AraC family two-component response regulator
MNKEEMDLSQIIEQLNLKIGERKISESDRFNYVFQNLEQNRERGSYSEEKIIYDAFSKGDLDTILEGFMKTNMAERVGIMAKIPFKQIEYTIVSGITLFCRASIEGGANPDEVYELSDIYLQKVSQSKDELELRQIVKNISIDLCECVRRAKMQNHKLSYIENCKRFVTKNLHKRFTLDDIATSIGINKCYLTNQFTKHEGKNLKRYIQEERIKAAQNMLKYSSSSLPYIASYLCFDSQSHFGSVFKKIVGVTPSAYRLEHKAGNIADM